MAVERRIVSWAVALHRRPQTCGKRDSGEPPNPKSKKYMLKSVEY